MADLEPVPEFDLPIPLADSPFDVPEREELELGHGLEGDPAIAFRRTLGMFATGVTILTTRAGDQVHGMTANAFMSVSLKPPLVLVSIDRRARLLSMLHEGTRFGVSVLESAQAGLSDRFGGRPRDDVPEPTFELAHDTPLVDGALAHLVARVVRSYWGGDHSLFLGQVEFARFGEGRPLLFHGGRYEQLTDAAYGLAKLPPELLEPALAHGVERRFADGEALMHAGESGDSMFVIVSGTVRVTRPGVSLALGAGEIVGEIAVLTGGQRTADVVAEGEVVALEISRDDVLSVLEQDSGAALALIAVLAARLRG